MPQYFFDTDDGTTAMPGIEGMDLPHREAARFQALAGLRDMAKDHLPDGDRRDFVVTVRSDGGGAIYTASLSLVGRWLN